MSSSNNIISEIEGFFKTRVYLEDIEGILNYAPNTLVGIDNISNSKLESKNIKTIEDLAGLNEENPPEIAGILPKLLLKWIKLAKVIKRAILDQIRQEKKVLMVGLDNGGKTSLLNIIKNKFMRDLMPTRGVKREKLDFFGFPIISWDLGGQVQFRENWYFKKPELYFSEANLMLYVVDIQDKNRFEESVEYFKKILAILEELEEKIPIVIVLNKSDPDIINTTSWESNISIVSDMFNEIIKQYELEYHFSITSIFQKETIIQMFSSAIKSISETSEIIEHILEDFANSVKARAVSLVSLEGLVFGTYTKTETEGIILNNTAVLLQTLEHFYHSKKLLPEPTILHGLPKNNMYFRGEKVLEYSVLKTPVYLWILSEGPDINLVKIELMKQELKPLVDLFL